MRTSVRFCSAARGWAILTLLLGGTVFPVLSAAGPGGNVESAVKAIRDLYQVREKAIGENLYRTCAFRLGGGQNPTEYLVHYEGSSEAEIARDPYASLFRLRRVVQKAVLPAVGEAAARFYYRDDGSAAFVFTTGVDLCGGFPFDLAPPSEVRAYFLEGKLCRLILSRLPGAGAKDPLVVDLPGCPDPALRDRAQKAGAILQRRAAEVAGALAVLAR